ncbi:amidohydrolase family protein [Myxococcota bacterium]|nr:amidohydrolase family protein [Myxococcota bacterium]
MSAVFVVALGAAVSACSGTPDCGPGTYPKGGVCVPFDPDPPDAGPRPDSGVLDTGAPFPDAGDAGFPDPPDAEVHDSGFVSDEPRVAALGERDRILLTGKAVLTMGTVDVIGPGEVYVEGDRIRCVGALGACAEVSSGASIVETNGVILPGLVDSHNHAAYDWMRPWTPGRLFQDATAWRTDPEYEAYTQPYRLNSDDAAKYCAMVQWAELRALVAGTTTIYGAVTSRACFRWLVRNAELSTGYNGFDVDRVRSNVLGVATLNEMDAAELIADMSAGQVDAYLIHVAEGLTARARGEYEDLVRLGLLRPETVIIHGTALTPMDFQAVGSSGARLVWSPASNVALYGATTDVESATNAGIPISLAPDWTPTGSLSLFSELRFAKRWLAENTAGLFTDRELLEMTTRVAAENLSIERWVGTLEAGKLADLLVVAVDDFMPYSSVIEARSADVRLVMIGGVPAYGDPAIVGALRETPASCHDLPVCGVIRRACWADTPDGPVSPASIATVIQGFYEPGPLELVECQ